MTFVDRPNHRRIRHTKNDSTINTAQVQKHVSARYYKLNYSADDGSEKTGGKNYNSLDESIWTVVINPERTVDE